jgi:DNA modification methylase
VRKEIIGAATLYLGDCREILQGLPMANVVVTDPPYGVTDHKWDVEVPPSNWMVAPGCVVFSAEPFTNRLISQAPLPFKYDLVWVKNTATNAMNAKIRPLRAHEQVLIFGTLPFFPQKRKRSDDELSRLNIVQRQTMEYASPESVLHFEAVNNRSGDRTEHPSQKPVDLLAWLIRTYTRPADVVLDPFMGSGSTGAACHAEGRDFIGIERESRYFDMACRRIEDARRQGRLIA